MKITKEQFKKLAKKHLVALEGYDINKTISIFGIEKLYDEVIKIEQQKTTKMKKDVKLPVYCTTEHFLGFEEWYELFEDFINIELAETGADREMCFNSEREFERRYEMYLNNMKEKEVIITSFSNVTAEGLTLHLNKKTSLKTGNIKSKSFWVSWDRIGELLFDNYTEEERVE